MGQIPKIIHYCWFGRAPLPKDVLLCIASWKKFLPEYEIIQWNEDNFPVSEFIYAKEALENRKFAFVSDVCRLYALEKMGGIYMDTDFEILQPLDRFLDHDAFTGFEMEDMLSTALMGAKPNSSWIKDFLNHYENRAFVQPNGSFEMITNSSILTRLMIDKGFEMNNQFQEKPGYLTIYPKHFFCPKSYVTGALEIDDETYGIHHFSKSWIPFHKKFRNNFKLKLMQVFGYENIQKIINIIRR